MSNIELHPIRDDKSNHPSPVDSVDLSDPLTTKGSEPDLHDIELSLTSSNPLLSPQERRKEGRLSLVISIWKWLLVIIAPTISIAYLAFCYVVHYQVVPANVPGLTTGTTTFITNVGAGITTINIIVISLALFPLKALLYELQSEEFFRLLSAPKNSCGVKLTEVNGISSPSYEIVESIMAVVHRHCSLYYVIAIFAALAIWATSTLAPAALTIQPVIVDGSIMAFSVGAIPPLSLYQPVAGGQTLLPSLFSPAPGYSAAIVWAEREIGLSYAFSVANDSQGTYAGFVVPTPPMLNSTVNARWLTDVIGVNPYCTWANPVNLTVASLNVTMNSTDAPTDAVSVHLQDVDLQVSVPSTYFPTYGSFFISSINVHDPTVTVLNYTTGSLPTDGSTVVSVIQCSSTSCTEEAINIVALFIDFTDIPSMNFSSPGADYEIGFLVCKPNITIETREIRTQGSMMLEVQPLPDNNGGVGYSLSGLSADSGPASSAWNGLGSGTQANFLFGSDQLKTVPTGSVYENTTMVLKPQSLDQLVQGYTQMVKASMKPYVSGLLGTSYVPGRVATVQQIFVSSLPHVIASTILVCLLFVIAIFAYFRQGKGDQFNLTNVAAALADSKLPEEARKAKIASALERERKWGSSALGGIHRRWWWMWIRGDTVGQGVVQKLGGWKVSLKRSTKEDGVEVLHISR